MNPLMKYAAKVDPPVVSCLCPVGGSSGAEGGRTELKARVSPALHFTSSSGADHHLFSSADRRFSSLRSSVLKSRSDRDSAGFVFISLNGI